MIAKNDVQKQDHLDAVTRLENMTLRLTDPVGWERTVLSQAMTLQKRLEAVDGKGSTEKDREERVRVFIDMYHLSCRAKVYEAPSEHFFWFACVLLGCERDRMAKEMTKTDTQLKSLEERLCPLRAENPDRAAGVSGVPEEYRALQEQFDQLFEQIEADCWRKVCEEYDAQYICELWENDFGEWALRYLAGREYVRDDRED